jgi:hypothetical protein
MSLADKIKDYLKRDETSEMSIHTDSFTLFLGKYPPKTNEVSLMEAQKRVGSLVDGTDTSSSISTHNLQGKSKESLLHEVKSLVGKKINQHVELDTDSDSDQKILRLPTALDVKQQGGGQTDYRLDYDYQSDSDISVGSFSSVDM